MSHERICHMKDYVTLESMQYECTGHMNESCHMKEYVTWKYNSHESLSHTML